MLRSKTAENTNICKLLTKLVQIDSKAAKVLQRLQNTQEKGKLVATHVCSIFACQRDLSGRHLDQAVAALFINFNFGAAPALVRLRLQHFSLISVEKRRLRCQQQQLAQDEAMHRESFHLPAGYFCYMGGY